MGVKRKGLNIAGNRAGFSECIPQLDVGVTHQARGNSSCCSCTPSAVFVYGGNRGVGGRRRILPLLLCCFSLAVSPLIPQLTGWGSKHCHLRIPGKQRESVNDLIFLPSVLVHVAWVFLSFAPCVAGHTGSLFSPPERAQSYKW